LLAGFYLEWQVRQINRSWRSLRRWPLKLLNPPFAETLGRRHIDVRRDDKRLFKS